MVLQRDVEINLWGWESPGVNVRIDFLGKTIETKADNEGKWSIGLPPCSAGGPYEMVITGQNTITLKNILIGEVWLASGQSNMLFELFKVVNSEEEIAGADYKQIHLFSVSKEYFI